LGQFIEAASATPPATSKTSAVVDQQR
jgi:hypothetical protein